MRLSGLFIGLILLAFGDVMAADVQTVVESAMAGLEVKVSDDPYSRTIERMYIGYDAEGKARVGIAHREIKSFKPITGVVVVNKTDEGFVLSAALFPDIAKIRNSKDRTQVLNVLKSFQNIPFDPHAEKSAVDGLTGATRYGIQTSGYLNYLARRTALEMESKPNWPQQKGH